MAKRSNFVVRIPEDLMFEILVRLPVKSLLRFKSVCKIWYIIIKSPNFIFMHHKFNLSRFPNLLICRTLKFQKQKNINNHVFTISPHDKSTSANFGILANPDTYVKCLGSCNGIVCYFDKNRSIYLSNPATREFKQLPPSSFESFETDKKFYQCQITFGSVSTNIYDFKVCRIFLALEKGFVSKPIHKALIIEMFTLSSNSWKQLGWGLDDRLDPTPWPFGVFYANSFHFLFKRCNSRATTIVCCDFHSERFRTMELPSIGGKSFHFLMPHMDFLSAGCYNFPLSLSDTSIEVWIMKDYGVVASWTKMYSIRHHDKPLFFWTEKDALVCRRKNSKLVLCHHDTLNCEPLEINGYNLYSQFLVYQETLVSIM